MERVFVLAVASREGALHGIGSLDDGGAARLAVGSPARVWF